MVCIVNIAQHFYMCEGVCDALLASCDGGNCNPQRGKLATRREHSLWKDDDASPLMEKLDGSRCFPSQPYLPFSSVNQSIQRQSITMLGTHLTKPYWKELAFLT